MNDAIRIIEAIGNQWPFLLVVFFIVVIIVRRKPIGKFISELTRFKIKQGNTELEFDKEKSSKKDEIVETNDVQKVGSFSEVSSGDNVKTDSDDLHTKHYKALKGKDFKLANDIFEKILGEEPDERKRKERKVGDFYWRHMHGDTLAFEELEEYISNIANDDEIKSQALLNLSYFYSDSSNPQKSIKLLYDAIDLSKEENHIAVCVARVSILEYENDNLIKSIEVLFEYLDILTERKAISNLYNSIANFYNKNGNKLLESIAYQKALEGKPNDSSLLFNAAFNYSDNKDKFNDLGLMLYNKLLRINPKYHNGLNNIGVSFQNLGMPIKSVDYYKKAVENESTLAASNLANILIKAGFKDEAESFINKAQELNDVDDNVLSSASYIKKQIKSETDLEKKITLIAERKFRFLKKFGQAAFTNNIIKLDTSLQWFINEQKANIKIENYNIIISWEIGEARHSLSGSLKRNTFELIYKKPKRNIYSYSDETKFTFNDYNGYGLIESESLILCIIEIEKELIDFKITYLNTSHNN